MKIINKRKVAFIFVILTAATSVFMAFQNFTSFKSESLGSKEASTTDSLAAALQAAEQDHTAKQMALNVEPTQIKETTKKDRKPQTIQIESEIIDIEEDKGLNPEEFKVDPKNDKLIIN